MKKFINKSEDFIEEMLEGLYKAYPNYYETADGKIHCLVTKHKVPGKVAIATGGGSGHLPLFLGYVGKGMLDGCAIGGVFQSPSAEEMLTVTEHIDNGAGVLYIYGNYNGDKFNFSMAAEQADFEKNINVLQCVVGEDVASGPRSESQNKNIRRGVAGIFFVYKIAAAAASAMKSLDEVKEVADRVAKEIATMGVAFTPCIVPRVGKSLFEISDDEMEIGMGIHGEAGIRRGKLQAADKIVEEVVKPIIDDLKLQSGEEVAVLINGLGATPLEEQFIINRKVNKILTDYGINVYRTYVGEYATSLEMAGASVSILRLDEEFKTYLDAQCDTPFFKQF